MAARGNRGILFLPNHPALIDPVIVISELYGRFAPSSLADKDRVGSPLLAWITRKFGALPMPDLGRYGEAGRKEVEQAIRDCAKLLAGGGNLVLYPGGHLMASRLEELGGNSAVETILKLAPGHPGGAGPHPGAVGQPVQPGPGPAGLPAGAGAAGLGPAGQFHLLLAPARGPVELGEPADLPRQAGREALNRRLEAFYNEDAASGPARAAHPLGGRRHRDPARSAPAQAGRGPGRGAPGHPGAGAGPAGGA